MPTFFDTYRNADGTPASGEVWVRPAVPYITAAGTVVDTWIGAELAADGSVTIRVDDAVGAQPGPMVWQVQERLSCHGWARRVWDTPAGLSGRFRIGDLRQLDAVPDRPTWQTSPAGPPGPTGPRGADGQPGPAGPAGPAGPKGDPGSGVTIRGTVASATDLPASGTTGDMWIAGDTGRGHVWTGAAWQDVGTIRGPAGPTGPAGVQGPPGQPGVQGIQGIQGPAGPVGPKGDTGDTGPAGPKGDQGEPGQGIQIVGSVASAAGLPTTGNHLGDSYLNSTDGHLLVYVRTGGTTGPPGHTDEWKDVGVVRGPQGPAGPVGPKGDTGDTGPAGPKGDTGAQGPAGQDGPQGPKGDPGQGIRILSAVATPADLPATGNTTGDAHLVTSTGNLHVWDGARWAEVGHIQGPAGPQGPQGPAGPPAGLPAGQDGQVLQYTGGTWQATDNLDTALARIDGLTVVVEAFTDATVGTWQATDYPADAVVTYQGQLYYAGAPQPPRPGDVPGVSNRWKLLTLEELYRKSTQWTPPRPDQGGADNHKVLTANALGDATWEPAAGGSEVSAITRRVPMDTTFTGGAAEQLWTTTDPIVGSALSVFTDVYVQVDKPGLILAQLTGTIDWAGAPMNQRTFWLRTWMGTVVQAPLDSAMLPDTANWYPYNASTFFTADAGTRIRIDRPNDGQVRLSALVLTVVHIPTG